MNVTALDGSQLFGGCQQIERISRLEQRKDNVLNGCRDERGHGVPDLVRRILCLSLPLPSLHLPLKFDVEGKLKAHCEHMRWAQTRVGIEFIYAAQDRSLSFLNCRRQIQFREKGQGRVFHFLRLCREDSTGNDGKSRQKQERPEPNFLTPCRQKRTPYVHTAFLSEGDPCRLEWLT